MGQIKIITLLYMPVQRGVEANRPFYRWGTQGKKYFYTPNNVKSRHEAKEKAMRQGHAIHASRKNKIL